MSWARLLGRPATILRLICAAVLAPVRSQGVVCCDRSLVARGRVALLVVGLEHAEEPGLLQGELAARFFVALLGLDRRPFGAFHGVACLREGEEAVAVGDEAVIFARTLVAEDGRRRLGLLRLIGALLPLVTYSGLRRLRMLGLVGGL